MIRHLPKTVVALLLLLSHSLLASNDLGGLNTPDPSPVKPRISRYSEGDDIDENQNPQHVAASISKTLAEIHLDQKVTPGRKSRLESLYEPTEKEKALGAITDILMSNTNVCVALVEVNKTFWITQNAFAEITRKRLAMLQGLINLGLDPDDDDFEEKLESSKFYSIWVEGRGKGKRKKEDRHVSNLATPLKTILIEYADRLDALKKKLAKARVIDCFPQREVTLKNGEKRFVDLHAEMHMVRVIEKEKPLGSPALPIFIAISKYCCFECMDWLAANQASVRHHYNVIGTHLGAFGQWCSPGIAQDDENCPGTAREARGLKPKGRRTNWICSPVLFGGAKVSPDFLNSSLVSATSTEAEETPRTATPESLIKQTLRTTPYILESVVRQLDLSAQNLEEDQETRQQLPQD